MELKSKNILFFTRAMGLGGTEKVILQLCEILNPEVNKIIVCSSGGINVEKLNSMGIKHYTIPDIENKSLNVVLSVIKSVNRIIKDERISIIHTHHRMAAFYSQILSYKNKFILINTSHNTFNNKRILTKFAFKNASLIACGDIVKNNLTEFYKINEKKITVIHNGVKAFENEIINIDVLDEYRKKGFLLVGNIGRLSEQKGFEYFIKSIPSIKDKVNKVKFFIVGEGEDIDKLKNLVYEMNLDDDVIFMGYRQDVQNVMSQLDLVVLTSLWEGLALTPIEAFSVNKTIVATAVDGTIEIVDDGFNGFLVEPKNIEEFAKKVAYLLCEREVRQQFETNSKNKYLNKFSILSFNKKYLDFYKKLYV